MTEPISLIQTLAVSAAGSLAGILPVAAIVGFKFGRWIQKTLNEYLRKEDHEDICATNQQTIMRALGDLKHSHEQAILEARQYRHAMANKVTNVEVKIAVIEERDRARAVNSR